MGYATLAACVDDLERVGQLVAVHAPIDPHLELAAVQRRAFAAKAPALLFTNVQGCAFPMLANLFGSRERIHYIFRDALPRLRTLFACKADPAHILRRPLQSLGALPALWNALPKRARTAPVLECTSRVSSLPQLFSWPKDGGAFITLPLVYSEHPAQPGFARSNCGMYRVQLCGNDYARDTEVGMHYQLHRGIGIHHSAALARGQELPLHVFVGGPPAMTVAAVMPLPEHISELHFAGALGARRIRMARTDTHPLPVWADADFCLSGFIAPHTKAEGPFGDHLGYYSLRHDFPVMRVTSVRHRRGAIWPFTSVGRPPQEDTLFGEFIHELTSPLVPQVFAGVHEVHAVDAAGVHPLLLAIGSERYIPYAHERSPKELLTCAFALLGSTQTALAKYVCIAAHEDDTRLNTHDIPHFFKHMLERTDFRRDLHFCTRTSTDTLDYTGTALNEGSKLIWAAAGPVRRTLGTELSYMPLPQGFADATLFAPGMVLVRGPRHTRARGHADPALDMLAQALGTWADRDSMPLVVVVDDTHFASATWENFLWVTFTRSDPSQDSYGAHAAHLCKHWGCEAPWILDARLKSYQAPPLEDDPAMERRIDALGARGGPLYGYI